MTHATEPDLGPLTWVKGEIDAALVRAHEILERGVAASDAAGLQFAQSHLHQVRGALDIVGLDGLTLFTDTLEQLLGAMARAEVPADAARRTLALRALAMVGNYLEELANGAADQPLRLADTYLALATARGQAQASAADLFHPDLSRRPPARIDDTPAVPPEQAAATLRSARSRFERGLLEWLRKGAAGEGARNMREAIAEVEALQHSPAARSLWWASLAFYDALIHHSLQPDPAVKRLCTQLDAQFRRLLSGTPSVPDRLLRELLYQVARAPVHTAQQRAVRECWQLDAQLPEAGAGVSDTPLAPLLDALTAHLGEAREHWDVFCAGTAVALPRFEAAVAAMSAPAEALARPGVGTLCGALLGFARWLRRDPLQFAEPAAMEVATALLMLEGALERRPPAPGFSTRAEVAAARLDALQRGETPAAASAPTLDDVRQAQERAALEQVSREMLASLAHVEQALDDFFRNQAKRDPLLRLHQPLQQIIGALSMLGETDALGLVRNAAVSIAGLAREDSRAGQADFERLARELSALGYYIEALPRGGARLEELLEPGRRTPTTAPTLSEQPSAPTPIVPTPPADTPRPSIPPLEPPLEPPSAPEFEPPAETPPPAMAAADATTATAEPFALDFPALDFDLELDSPPPPSLPAEESAAAEARTAEPSTALHAHPADDALTPPLQASASTVDTSGTLGVEALATATVPPDDAAASSAAPAPAPAEAEIDAELLAIFIEEAHEVLGGIATHLDDLRGEADPQVDLVTIRRGFHTLKGSGRMVGLVELGDTAWAVEQALNRWLQLDWPVTPALLALIGEGHRVFSAWVAQLQHGGAGGGDASALVTEARRLHEAGEASHEPGLASVDGHLPQIPEPAQPAAPAPAPDAPAALQIDSEDFVLEGELGLPEALAPAAAVVHSTPDIDAEVGIDAEAEAEADVEPLGEIGADADAEGEEALIEFVEPLEEGEPFALDTLGELDVHEALEALAPLDLEALSVDLPPTAPPEAGAMAGTTESVRIGDGEISRALHELYCTESAQHLHTLDEALQAMQAAPGPPSMVAVRAAHTLAGISGTVRAGAPSRLGRALEHALARLADAGLAPTAAAQHTLAETIATLHRMRAEIVAERTPEPADELCARLEAETADVFASLAGPTAAPGPAAPAEPANEARTPAPALATVAPAEHAGAAAEAVAEAEVHDDIDTQLLPIFLEEAVETVGELHAILRGWRAEPDAGEAPRAVARQLHSLKGSARMAGAMRLGARLHQLESRLEDGLASQAPAAALVDELTHGIDRCEQIIDRLALGDEAAARLAPEPLPTAPAGEAQPAAETEPLAAPTLRVRAERVDRFVNQAGEIGVARSRVDGELRTLRRSLLDLTENVIRLRNQLREVEIQAEVQMQSRIAQAGAQHAEFDPLELDRYTRLQELTRMMAESVNDVTTVQHGLLHNLDTAELALGSQARMARELQQGLMQVRMLPFDSLASRLYRVVRQSARELGKRATLDLRGGRIEVDRSVLEQMAAPLEHLLRNAVAHGIELPAQRSAAGKPESGSIVLSVGQEGNEIAITIADDGAGLDLERIATQARARGLLSADEPADERRLTNLIFTSGFSTAREVSAVSGRGVGMDVVKAQTAAAGGRIEVSSRRGEGTRFALRLPLTLAVTQALLVQAGGRSWAVPSNMIVQAMEIKSAALHAMQEARGTEWQGEHYPYRYLPRLLGDRESRPPEARYNWVLLLRAGTQTLALHVDGVRGNQEIIVKNAGPQLTRIVGMSGATMLGDGEIVLILNPVALAARAMAHDEAGDSTFGPAAEAPPPLHLPTVMVVDDSLTVRKITGRLLEREGYRVLTAKDGVDALEQLIELRPDVLLTDLEMPRMDGFDLIRNVRADVRLRDLPVVVITSRLAERHRRYAQEVGANHYLGKPYQEEELLALVARYARTGA
jgi:chemosensory pili system protein ChpA (sensor histidine kinase/response regulator)